MLPGIMSKSQRIKAYMIKEKRDMYKLGFILENIDKFKWSDALYLPEDEIWNKDTEGMVLDSDNVENDEDEVPKEAKEKNLIYALNIQIIQSIVDNSYQQKSKLSVEELVEAYLYYYDYDAYIDFEMKEEE